MRSLDTLHSLQSDLQLCIDAIAAGQPQIAATTLTAWADRVQDEIVTREAPRYSSYAQNKYLAVLTGWASHPPRYWQELQLTPAEASDAINELKLMQQAEIRGRMYYRVTTDQQEKNATLRKKLGTTKGRKRKAA